MLTENNTRLAEVGRCAIDSIVEMVDALDREKCAESYARNLSRERCVALLTDECGIDCEEDETVEELREAVAVNVADETMTPDDFEFDEDAARDRIMEDPLSLEFRSDWGAKEDLVAAEFCLLLTTGGPAVRIIGDVDGSNVRLEVQDWGTPWTEHETTAEQDAALSAYVGCFCLDC